MILRAGFTLPCRIIDRHVESRLPGIGQRRRKAPLVLLGARVLRLPGARRAGHSNDMPSHFTTMALAAWLAACGAAPSPEAGPAPAAKAAAGEPIVCTETTEVYGADWACSVSIDGGERYFFLTLPAEAQAKAPLVLNLHGFSSNPQQQNEWSRLPEKTKAAGYLLATVGGVGTNKLGLGFGMWNGGGCCVSTADDAGLLRMIIDFLIAEYGADAKRVYSTGLSNGGLMSYWLACDMAEKIAAVVSVAAGDLTACHPAEPVSVMEIHGTDDPLVPYNGGKPQAVATLPSIMFPSVTDTVSKWVAHNACTAVTEAVYTQGEVTCIRHTGCQGGSVVEWCKVDGGGHTWPSGSVPALMGHTTFDLDASDYMLAFFGAHAKR